MREAIEKVLEAMREDYKRWSDRCAKHDSYAHYSDVKNEMEKNYCNGQNRAASWQNYGQSEQADVASRPSVTYMSQFLVSRVKRQATGII